MRAAVPLMRAAVASLEALPLAQRHERASDARARGETGRAPHAAGAAARRRPRRAHQEPGGRPAAWRNNLAIEVAGHAGRLDVERRVELWVDALVLPLPVPTRAAVLGSATSCWASSCRLDVERRVELWVDALVLPLPVPARAAVLGSATSCWASSCRALRRVAGAARARVAGGLPAAAHQDCAVPRAAAAGRRRQAKRARRASQPTSPCTRGRFAHAAGLRVRCQLACPSASPARRPPAG
jgi:hypothetical protein